jgi:hypothetical protein
MFNCKEVSRLVSDSMDRSLPFYKRVLIRMHLFMCKYCKRFKNQLELLRAASRHDNLLGKELEPSHSLSQNARERLKKFLENHLRELH